MGTGVGVGVENVGEKTEQAAPERSIIANNKIAAGLAIFIAYPTM
jgi:hypothetical protein